MKENNSVVWLVRCFAYKTLFYDENAFAFKEKVNFSMDSQKVKWQFVCEVPSWVWIISMLPLYINNRWVYWIRISKSKQNMRKSFFFQVVSPLVVFWLRILTIFLFRCQLLCILFVAGFCFLWQKLGIGSFPPLPTRKESYNFVN